MIRRRLLTVLITAACASSFSYATISDNSQPAKNNYPKYNLIQELANRNSAIGQERISARKNAKYHELMQGQAVILTDLKTKLSKLQMKNDAKSSLLSLLNSSIDKRNSESANRYGSKKVEEGMNFLDLRLSDAVMMLMVVNLSARQTGETILKMRELASAAASGTASSDELEALDMKFQGLKNAVHYMQRVGLLNGEKIISGGDITIQFGEDSNPLSTLTIKLPAFDSTSLMLDELSITNVRDANQALYLLSFSINTINEVLVTLNTPAVDDAINMLRSIPFVLNQDFDLLAQSQILAMQSVNGTASSSDRAYLEVYFNYLKAALNKTQTYITLDGPKMLGTGKIHIQIGPRATPETTLTIDIPVTDIKLLGIDNLSVATQNDGYHALEEISKHIYNFTYNS